MTEFWATRTIGRRLTAHDRSIAKARVSIWRCSTRALAHEDPRHEQDRIAKDGSPRLGLPRSRKGAWRRGRLDLTGGDLFLHDGNVRWRRRAVSDGNPRSPARSPSCRDCAFLPVVRFRCLCRDRCRLSVTLSPRRCVFDWWRVARHEQSCGGDSAVDFWKGFRESCAGPADSYTTVGSSQKRRVGRFPRFGCFPYRVPCLGFAAADAAVAECAVMQS
jgi:hypothetical protein